MRQMIAAIAIALISGGAFGANDHEIMVNSGGEITMRDTGLTFRPGIFNMNWGNVGAVANLEGYTIRPDGSWPFYIKYDSKNVNGKAWFSKFPNGKVRAKWRITPDFDADSHGICVTATFHQSKWGGGSVIADGKVYSLPSDSSIASIVSGGVRKLTFKDATGRECFNVEFDQPQLIQLQNDSHYVKEWKNIVLRIYANTGAFKSGHEYAVDFWLSGPDVGEFHELRPVTIAEGDDWVPIPCVEDVVPGSAMDFSQAIPCRHSPAGKFGHVVVKGENFEFENMPGVPQRFVGANVCGPSTVLGEKYALRLAKRLAAVGYNSVRFHNHDWAFCGKQEDGTSLDEGAMRNVDAMFAAFKNEGLYVTIDLFVNRKIPWRSCGVERDGCMTMNDFKVWVQFHEGTFSNLLAHSRALLSRVNTKTGIRYADDPALAFLSLVNEANIGNFGKAAILKCPDGKLAWERFVGDHGGKDDDSLLDEFYAECERRFARRVTDFLRNEMKSRILTTNMNVWYYSKRIDEVRRAEFDYADQHDYVAHPRFLGPAWSAPVSVSTSNPLDWGMYTLEKRRLAGLPFAVSEWNYCMPLAYRSQAGLAMGLMAAAGNWSALWRYAWSDNPMPIVDPNHYPLQFFMIGADPLALATERATTCMFLRGDADGLRSAIGHARTTRTLSIDSARTSGGWAPNGVINAGALRAKLDSPAAVWASVIDGNSFADARRITVFHLTEVLNSGMQFADDTRRLMLREGSTPLLARSGKAEISMALGEGDWHLYALASDGSRKAELKIERDDGRYEFEAEVERDRKSATIAYELFRP